ncbi:MAG: zf-TFIIB domain-containing protein, partial [Gemmatimonadales bacterium]
VLDYCPRCGGIWFDEGEVPLLRRCQPRALAARVELSTEVQRMKCHGCGASLLRDEPRCGQCGWRNLLECPTCGAPLAAVERGGLRLDACRRCRGVWFDNAEVATIWNERVTAVVARRPGAAAPAVYTADYFLLDAVLWTPDLVINGVAVGAHVAGSGFRVLADGASAIDLGQVAGGAVEGAGELAGSVFEAIAELIGGLFG